MCVRVVGLLAWQRPVCLLLCVLGVCRQSTGRLLRCLTIKCLFCARGPVFAAQSQICGGAAASWRRCGGGRASARGGGVLRQELLCACAERPTHSCCSPCSRENMGPCGASLRVLPTGFRKVAAALVYAMTRRCCLSAGWWTLVYACGALAVGPISHHQSVPAAILPLPLLLLLLLPLLLLLLLLLLLVMLLLVLLMSKTLTVFCLEGLRVQRRACRGLCASRQLRVCSGGGLRV